MWKVLLIFSGISSDVFQSSSVIENNNSSQCVHRLSSPANLDLSMFLFLGGLHSTVPAIIALILNVLIINALIRHNRYFNRGTMNSSRGSSVYHKNVDSCQFAVCCMRLTFLFHCGC